MESAGAVRLSLGIASNFADVARVVQFAGIFVDDEQPRQDLPPRPEHC
jgi:hypothetical protein